MIRTLVEIQGGRVSIRETAAETTVTVTVDSASSEVEESPAESSWRDSLNRNQLLTEIDFLEKGLERYRKDYTESIQLLAEAEAQMESERKRADQNKEWAERAEARLAKDAENHMRSMSTQVSATAGMKERVRVLSAELDEKNSALANQVQLLHGPNGVRAKLAEVEEDRDRLTAKIQKIDGTVHDPDILAALEARYQADHHDVLANAVRNVRQIVGSPESETSQA